MRERDGLDYVLVVAVAVLAAIHVPPVRVIRRETVAIAHETGIAAVVDLLVDVRVAVVLLALLGLVLLLVMTDSIPLGE